jgi:hypothetical protein
MRLPVLQYLFGNSVHLRQLSDIALAVLCLIVLTPNVGEVYLTIQSDEVDQYHQSNRHNYQIQIPSFHAS